MMIRARRREPPFLRPVFVVVIFVSGVRIFAGVGWDAAATVVSVPVEDFNRPSSGIAAVLVADASAD